MAENTVRGQKRLSSSNTLTNAITYLVDQRIAERVETSDIVSIGEADQAGTGGAAGFASATPLVCQTDGFGNAIPSAAIPQLPFYRPQAGKAAIIMDPQPGDKAIAIYQKRDSSGITTGANAPSRPASFRSFSQADGVLLNGVKGEAPEIWLELNPASGNISLSTKAAAVEISCRESGDMVIKTASGNITIECTVEATVKAPDIILDGNVRVTGNLVVEGKSTGVDGGPAVFSNGIVNEAGGFSNTGGIQNTGGTTVSNNVSVEGHQHSGVTPGGGDTASPTVGT